MKASEFVEAYPLDVDPGEVHLAPAPIGVQQAHEWSYSFGRLLHNRLADNSPAVDAGAVDINAYDKWFNTTYKRTVLPLAYEAAIDKPEPQVLDDESLMGLNFHLLNHNMRGMWRPIVDGQWGSDSSREHSIHMSQKSLAVMGTALYIVRQEFADQQGSTALFETEEGRALHREIGGTMQEIDAGIVLLEVARRNPGLTVVPAPLNFERTRKHTNVDFVAYDSNRQRAVGVQVKSMVTNAMKDSTDTERVIFVDGGVDLDNVRTMRIKSTNTYLKRVSWGGMIATRKLTEMKADTKPSKPRITPGFKAKARKAIGEIRVDFRGITDKVEQRVIDNL